MRTFAIGDIHGCLDKLEDLLAKIEPLPDDTLIFLGDYIDRGENPAAVIDRLFALATATPCIFLRGNHEDMLLNYLEWGTNRDLYLANGGDTTMHAYTGERCVSHTRLARSLPHDHRVFYERLRWYYEDENYIYVHAGLKPGVPLDRQDRTDLVWIRDEFIYAPTGMDKKIIFAHTPLRRPLVHPDKIGIDTGAVYGGCLTAIELPVERFLHSRRLDGPDDLDL